jgi:ankyrin repeat protein
MDTNCVRFLWVHFQLLDLCDAATDHEVRKTLYNLPQGMIETYVRILQKIAGNRSKKALAQQMFKWIVCAKRPMLLVELAEAVAFKSTDTFWDREKIPRPERLYEACGNLVVISEDDQTIRLAHNSVQQFLLEPLLHQKLDYFHISPSQVDIELGETCVAYLFFSDFETQIAVPNRRILSISHMPEPKMIMEQATSSSGLSSISSSIFQFQNRLRSSARSSRPMDFDLAKFAKLKSSPSRTLHDRYRFLDYAIQNWVAHTSLFSEHNTNMWRSFKKLALDKNLPFDIRPWGDINERTKRPFSAFIQWATSVQHLPLLQLLPENCSIADELLLQTIRNGNSEVVQMLVAKGANVEAKDEDGRTALHEAAALGDAAIVELLIAKKANVEAKDVYGCTALLRAAMHGHAPIVKLLMAQETYVDAKDDIERSLLHIAAIYGHTAIVELLLVQATNVLVRDQHRERALHVAVNHGQTTIVELLAAQTDVYGRVAVGRKLLHRAAARGNAAIVELLLTLGANLETTDQYEETALHKAVEEGHVTVVELLLSNGANVEAVDNRSGETALHKAVKKKHTAIVELLISKGANVEAKDTRSGETVLHKVVRNKDTKIMELLIAKGACIETKDNIFGETALHMAVNEENIMIVQLLISKGANLETTNIAGETALHKTVRNKHTMIAELLISEGADVEAKREGDTILLKAVKQNHTMMVNLLLSKGVDVEAEDWEGLSSLHWAVLLANSGMVGMLVAHEALVKPMHYEAIRCNRTDYAEKETIFKMLNAGRRSIG